MTRSSSTVAEHMVSLDTAIERLNSNDPVWDMLVLNDIVMNPTPATGFGGTWLVSHIRDHDLQMLAEALRANTTIRSIVIDGTDSTRSLEWSEIGARAFGEAIKNHPKLTRICLGMSTFAIKEKQIIGFLYCLTGSAKINFLGVDVSCDSSKFMDELGEILLTRSSLEFIYIQGSPERKRKEEKSSVKFASGLGKQIALKHLDLSCLQIGDSGIADIAHSLTTSSLQSISFRSCGITRTTHVCAIVASNPNLAALTLSNNPLNTVAIQQLSCALPLLKNLRCLDLNDTGLNKNSLMFLVEVFLKHQLAISRFNIDSTKIDGDSIDIVIKLIDGNLQLKHLYMNFCGISDSHINKMKAILMNPLRCQLETFDFSGNLQLSEKTYGALLDILRRNEFMCDLGPPLHSEEHREAISINLKKKDQRERQAFINTMVTLSQAYHAKPTTDTRRVHLGLIPQAVFINIMQFLGENTPGMKPRDVYLCNRLIIENFGKRRDLMDAKTYDPATETLKDMEYKSEQGIGRWWSQSIVLGKDGTVKRIFKHADKAVFFRSESENKDSTGSRPATEQRKCIIM